MTGDPPTCGEPPTSDNGWLAKVWLAEADAHDDHKILVVNGLPGAGKTHLLTSLLHRLASDNSSRQLRQNIAELDWLRSGLSSKALEPADTADIALHNICSAFSYRDESGYTGTQFFGDAQASGWRYNSGQLSPIIPAAAAVASISTYANPTIVSWFTHLDFFSAVASALSTDGMISYNTASVSAVDCFAPEIGACKSPIAPTEAKRTHSQNMPWPNQEKSKLTVNTVQEFLSFFLPAISENIRNGLLRLIDGARAALWLILVLVLNALSRFSVARSLGLIILAVSRHFGHRSEPSDHVLPALTSMSAVIGEVTRSVS